MLTMSFILDGDFASFKDPSITTSQIVYYIPSKSSVIGIIGAIIGITRSHGFERLYSDSFIELMKKMQVGVELLSEPKKIIYYTNHRSLKESKTKPFKKEVSQFPRWRIYISSEYEEKINEVFNRINNNDFNYSPYLGHAYCPARLTDATIYDDCIEACGIDGELEFQTSAVVLDESENYDDSFEIQKVDPIADYSSILIERHLHHFFNNEVFQNRVLKFWIPVKSSYSFYISKKPTLSKLLNLGKDKDSIVCIY